jgi:cyclase
MKISSRCYAVTGLGYLPPWEVNAGIAAGGTMTLVVDTGPSALAAMTIYGYAQAAAPSNRIIAINTEPHFDHMGGNSFFASKEVQVYGHELICRSSDAIEHNIASLNEAVLDLKRRHDHEAEVFFADTFVVNPTTPFSDPFSIDLGGVTAEIVLLPGHTSANSGVWIPLDGVLFSGDALTEGYAPNLNCGSGESSWRQWLSSLEQIELLSPRFVVPGHGRVMFGAEVKQGIERVRGFLMKELDGNF